MFNFVKRYLKWWEDKLLHSLGFLFITHIIQLPHIWWNIDLYFDINMISRVNEVADAGLFGVDLIEIPALIAIGSSFFAKLWFSYQSKKKTNIGTD